MAEREIDINTTSSTAASLDNPQLERSEVRARLAQVLERGMIQDRFKVDLPPELYGEWVANDDQEITRKQLLGYRIDTQYAHKNKLNDTGDGKAVIGDVVHMVCDRVWKEEYDAIQRQRYIDTHLKNPTRQKEEKDFETLNNTTPNPTVVASHAENVTGATIRDTLKG